MSSLSGTSGTNQNTYNIAKRPLFFVRGGDVNSNTQQLGSAGQNAFYWSSRAYSSSTNAYYLSFYASSVNPSNFSGRYYGYPLRCLIPTP